MATVPPAINDTFAPRVKPPLPPPPPIDCARMAAAPPPVIDKVPLLET